MAGARPRPSAVRPPDPLFDPLEARTLLFAGTFVSNLPDIAELEDPNHSVVRMQTNYGVIDIELFESVAPTTVANFKKYVMEGAYDQMFFHRLVTDFVLQGGGYKFEDGLGKRDVVTRPPINNEFNRSNLERTVAMAKFPNDPNSATSQFFFNLRDNPNLNTQNGGFTVFGRVIRGWASVQAMAALSVRDMDLDLTGTNPEPGTFEEVPTSTPFAPPVEDSLAYVWDTELIKPSGVGSFYTEALLYPEGFRGAGVIERVDIANTQGHDTVHFQVIVRYETGDRDEVIAYGTIAPFARLSVKTADFTKPNDPLLNRVRQGVGYAFEIRSTEPLAATLNHRDFGVTLVEPFVSVKAYQGPWMERWTFAHGDKGVGVRSFLVWQNLTDQRVTVHVTIYSNTGTPKTFTRQLERYARGGLNVHEIGLIPDGRYSARITSTAPIVAAQSVYLTTTSPPVGTYGAAASGTILGGRTEGYLASASIVAGALSYVSVNFAAGSPAAVIVDFFFYLQNGTMLTANSPVTLTSSIRRVDRNLAAFGVNLPANQSFSIGYHVRNDAAPVTVNYFSNRNGDWMSTPFTTHSTATMHFADGYLDPANMNSGYSEVLSIFNPYTDPDVTFTYQVRFRFHDGSTVQGAQGTLAPHGRIDINTKDLPGVVNRVNLGPQYRFYSIVVTTFQSTSEGSFIGAGVAQLTRVFAMTGWDQTMTTGPSLDPLGQMFFLSAAQFN